LGEVIATVPPFDVDLIKLLKRTREKEQTRGRERNTIEERKRARE